MLSTLKPRRQNEVRNILDSLSWVEHDCAVLEDDPELPDVNQAASLFNFLEEDGESSSSAFSGIGGEETAGSMLIRGLQKFSGKLVRPHNVTFAIERLAESRHELMMNAHPPECIFGDITDFLKDGIRDILKQQCTRLSYGELKRIVVDCVAGSLRTPAY